MTSAYTGYPWDELARRLAVPALGDLRQSVEAGTIYNRCRRAGFSIAQRSELQRPPIPEHIAAEAVEECLERFKTQVLPRGEWDPERGVPLEAFFSSCCLADIANVWRRQLRQFPLHAVELDALDEHGQAGVLGLVAGLPADPATVVELRDVVAQTLAPLNPQDRTAFQLPRRGPRPHALQGKRKTPVPEGRQPRPRTAPRTRRARERPAQAVGHPPQATLLPAQRRHHRPRNPHPHHSRGQSSLKKAQ